MLDVTSDSVPRGHDCDWSRFKGTMVLSILKSLIKNEPPLVATNPSRLKVMLGELNEFGPLVKVTV